jgi:hypothetical protein
MAPAHLITFAALIGFMFYPKHWPLKVLVLLIAAGIYVAVNQR